jgi:hypothetical protein
MKTELEQEITGDYVFHHSANPKFHKKADAVSDYLGIKGKAAQGVINAAWSSPFTKSIAATAALGAGAAMAGAAIKGIGGAISKIMSYRRMLRQNPDLNEYGAEKLKRHFDILYTYGPSVAQNPTLASGFIRTVNQYQIEGHDFVPPDTVKGLIDIENGIATIQSKRLMNNITSSAVEGGAKEIGKHLAKSTMGIKFGDRD